MTRSMMTSIAIAAAGTAILLYACGAFAKEGGPDPMLRVPPAHFLGVPEPIQLAQGSNGGDNGGAFAEAKGVVGGAMRGYGYAAGAVGIVVGGYNAMKERANWARARTTINEQGFAGPVGPVGDSGPDADSHSMGGLNVGNDGRIAGGI